DASPTEREVLSTDSKFAGSGVDRIASAVEIFVFFFQAEDGIRDWSVTGVQTCALPICYREAHKNGLKRYLSGGEASVLGRRIERSEERRVGKECRSRGSPYH